MKRLKTLGLISVLAFSLVFSPVVRAQESKEEKKVSDTQKKLEKILADVKTEVKKEAQEAEKAKEDVLEIDGLIIDQTQTKVGYEFYEIFYTLWEAPKETKGYTIFISERAHPRFGSRVSIAVNETTIYQNVLKPRFEVIEEAAKAGVEATKQFLYRRDQDQRQLADEDMAGTGIY